MRRYAVLTVLLVFASPVAFGQRATQSDYTHCQQLLKNQKPLDIEHLSSADEADLELCRMSRTMDGIRARLSRRDSHFEFWQGFRREAVSLWFDVLDAFCEFHPTAQYLDIFDNVEHCPSDTPPIHTNRETLDKLFLQSEVLSNNFSTFANTQDEEDRLNKR
ncbi:MAG: hypothetical protein WB799_24250 [Candidatus Sulfotelmatobacter sp.]